MPRIDDLRNTIHPAPPLKTVHYAYYSEKVPFIDFSRRPEGLLPGERWGGQLSGWEVKDIRKKVERIARKCARHGLPVPTCTTRENPDSTFDLLVEGLSVRLPGDWRVTAVIDHAGDGMAVAAPGAPEDTVRRWTGAEATCDECGRNLRRSRTVVIADKDGNEKQVGGQCATTYLGMTVEVCRTLVAMINDEEEDDWSVGRERMVSAAAVLNMAVAITRTYGWKSKAKAEEQGGASTAELTTLVLLGGNGRWEILNDVQMNYDLDTEEHARYMAGLHEWAATVGGNNYLDSLNFLVTQCEGVSVKRIGLLASAPQAYDRHLAEQQEQERKAEGGAVAEVPATADRIKVVGTVQRVKYVDTMYGMQTKMLLATDEGYRLWGTVPSSLDSDGGVEAGDRVEFMARVERSRDDATFGFYSRPTKARALESAA